MLINLPEPIPVIKTNILQRADNLTFSLRAPIIQYKEIANYKPMIALYIFI